MSNLDFLYGFPNDTFLGDYPDVDQRTCRLLGPTALVVQAMMGLLVILSLVYKRHREKPKRPWRIWMFDVSKQIAGQMFVHGVNVFISDFAAHHVSGNPCVIYFLNILIDTTLGVAVIYLILHLMSFIFTDKLRLKGFQSGQYGDPPLFSFWIRQATVYVFALTTMKLLVVGLFAVWPGITKVGAWLLSWTGGGDAVQVIFVMGLFPICMNILQFWLIDSIVKSSAVKSDQGEEAPPENTMDRQPLFGAPDSDDDDDDEAPVHDIENPRTMSFPRVRSPHGSDKLSDDDEQKYTSSGATSSTPTDRGVVLSLVHGYPPSSSSPSPSPDSSSVISIHHCSEDRASSRRYRGKRSPPPPLQLDSSKDASRVPTVIPVGPTPTSNARPGFTTSPLPSYTNEKSTSKSIGADWTTSWDSAANRHLFT